MEARTAIVLPGYGDKDEGEDGVHLSTDPKLMNPGSKPGSATRLGWSPASNSGAGRA
jgi:hypothetical protein